MMSLSSMKPSMSRVMVSLKSMGGRRMARNISGESEGRVPPGSQVASSPANMNAMVEGKLTWRATKEITTTKMRILYIASNWPRPASMGYQSSRRYQK